MERMWLPGGRTGLLVALVAWSSACVGGQPQAHGPASPRPAASAPSPDPQRCARLARRGFAVCPPTPDRLPLPPTTIRNATNGAIPDRTAQQWGRAFQLAQAYYYWAMQHNLRGALTSGALADPAPDAVTNLFGTDLMDLDVARQKGGRLVYQPPGVSTAQVVVIPVDLQQAMQRQYLTAKGYGIAVRLMGPTSRTIELADGAIQPIAYGDASYTAAILAWGESKDDPDLGRIWYEYGYYGCDGAVRNVCQL